MPIYCYEPRQGEAGCAHCRAGFEVLQDLDEPALTRCPQCGALVERVIARGGILIVVAPDAAAGLEAVNRFAPEHFEIMTKNPLATMKGVRAAGAVFAGEWTPESAGDFVAGPSHVLPTGGAANMFNGLTPDDFRRRHSFVSFTRGDLAETREAIETFAEAEALQAHGRAASVRFGKKNGGRK